MTCCATRSLPLFALLAILVGCQRSSDQAASALGTRHVASIVEAACGECQFGLPGEGCDLAVRIEGQAYYVDGSSIDDHGDAHDADGLCNAVRQARVTGRVVEGRFVAESIELIEDGE